MRIDRFNEDDYTETEAVAHRPLLACSMEGDTLGSARQWFAIYKWTPLLNVYLAHLHRSRVNVITVGGDVKGYTAEDLWVEWGVPPGSVY